MVQLVQAFDFFGHHYVHSSIFESSANLSPTKQWANFHGNREAQAPRVGSPPLGKNGNDFHIKDWTPTQTQQPFQTNSNIEYRVAPGKMSPENFRFGTKISWKAHPHLAMKVQLMDHFFHPAFSDAPDVPRWTGEPVKPVGQNPTVSG